MLNWYNTTTRHGLTLMSIFLSLAGNIMKRYGLTDEAEEDGVEERI